MEQHKELPEAVLEASLLLRAARARVRNASAMMLSAIHGADRALLESERAALTRDSEIVEADIREFKGIVAGGDWDEGLRRLTDPE